MLQHVAAYDTICISGSKAPLEGPKVPRSKGYTGPKAPRSQAPLPCRLVAGSWCASLYFVIYVAFDFASQHCHLRVPIYLVKPTCLPCKSISSALPIHLPVCLPCPFYFANLHLYPPHVDEQCLILVALGLQCCLVCLEQFALYSCHSI